MDTVKDYQQIVQNILLTYTQLQYAHGEFHNFRVFDCETDNYLVLSEGWDGDIRIHGCLIHLQILDGKVWVQRDGTEDGIANDLVEAGIPKDHIVLGFHPPEVRPYTDYAAA
jgi:hypothetical protein